MGRVFDESDFADTIAPAPQRAPQMAQAAPQSPLQGQGGGMAETVARNMGQAIPGAMQATLRAPVPGLAPQEQAPFMAGVQERVEDPEFLPAAGAAAGGMLAAPLAAGMGISSGLGLAGVDAALTGAGAAGGEAFRSAVMGEQGVQDAALDAGESGLVAAMASLGINALTGSAGAILKAAGPTMLQVFDRIPGQAMRRMLVRWRDMPTRLKAAAGNQEAVERFGVKALRDVQDKVLSARQAAGKQVDEALRGFHAKVNGKAVVNTAPAADALENVISTRGLADEAVEAAVPAAEMKRLSEVAEAIRNNPNKTPLQAVQLRRAVDDLTKFKKGGVTPITSSAGQQAAREMGAALRSAIQEAADSANYTKLANANANASKIYNLYDEAAEIFATKSRSQLQLLKKFDQVANQYYAGGLKTAVLDDMATAIPGAKQSVNELIDAASVRAYERPPQGTPSGLGLNIVRLLSSPKFVGYALRNRETFGGLGPISQSTAGASAAASTARQRRR